MGSFHLLIGGVGALLEREKEKLQNFRRETRRVAPVEETRQFNQKFINKATFQIQSLCQSTSEEWKNQRCGTGREWELWRRRAKRINIKFVPRPRAYTHRYYSSSFSSMNFLFYHENGIMLSVNFSRSGGNEGDVRFQHSVLPHPPPLFVTSR